MHYQYISIIIQDNHIFYYSNSNNIGDPFPIIRDITNNDTGVAKLHNRYAVLFFVIGFCQ